MTRALSAAPPEAPRARKGRNAAVKMHAATEGAGAGGGSRRPRYFPCNFLLA